MTARPAKSRALFHIDSHETTVDEVALFAFLRRRGFVKGAWPTAPVDVREEVRLMAQEIVHELAELGTALSFPRDKGHPVRLFVGQATHGNESYRRWLLRAAEDFIEGRAMPPAAPQPTAMIIFCPICHERHIDVGEFATKVHHTHSCQHCGFTWRPAVEPTVGVQFLPGFKDKVPVR